MIGASYGVINPIVAAILHNAGSLIVVESNQAREILFPEALLLLKHNRYGSVTLDILRKQ